MRPTDDDRLQVVLVIALVLIVVGGTVDLVLDRPGSWLTFHVFFEVVMIAGAMTLATALWLGWWRAERSARDLRASLQVRSAERDAWRRSAEGALAGLGEAIQEQFVAWELTPAEREVALLLLKGHSHKAIARLTERSPATVRQHAASVYARSGLAGRAELAAFFLEDIMLPREERPVRSDAPAS